MDKQLLKYSAWYSAYVVFLHVVDGPWNKWSAKGDNPPFDMWTLTHLAWGGIARKFKVPLKTLLILSIINEAGEAYLRHIKFLGLWGDPEGKSNVVVDIAATAAGWYLTKAIS